MFLRMVFFGLMALGFVGFATVTWFSLHHDGSTAPVAAAEKINVLIAARPICPGTLITASDVSGAPSLATVVADALPDTAEARAALIGATARHCLAVGNAIPKTDIVHPGERDFMATVLAPGARAVSVIVEALAGTSGLAWAGDHVDLILTQTISDPALPIGRRVAAETVARDVRVLAIEQPAARGPEAGNAEMRARTVTLEVSAVQAQRISVAARIGKLSLSIQSGKTVAAVPDPATATTTWASDVSAALGLDAPKAPRSTLNVFQGVADAKEFRF